MTHCFRRTPQLICRTVLIALLSVQTLPAQESKAPPAIKVDQLGSTRNVHSFGLNLLCGQPSESEFADAKKRGVKVVITLRSKGEIDWDEAGLVKKLGMEFHDYGFRDPADLTDKVFDGVRAALQQSNEKPVMVHCASANRVGAVWLAHRVLDAKIPVEAALAEARAVGLRTPAYEERAYAYIAAEQKKAAAHEKSVKPGINANFLSPDFDASKWQARFEVESREVFAHRDKVVAAVGIKPGNRIADIGAGTGIYSRAFAAAVGAEGKVVAVDIAKGFLKHIEERATAENITNIATVLCSEDSVDLPENSIDAVFVCDTYHHFEYPKSTLASIRKALKKGGTLVVIDFDRIPGKSREFILGHVRAGKDVFRSEIEAAGFKFVEEVKIDGLKENYFLRFRRP